MYSCRFFSTLFLLFGVVATQIVDKCQTNNPIYDCYVTVTQQISSNPDLVSYCRAVKTYLNCTEAVACECQLGNSALVLTQITQYAEFYRHYNCNTALNEPLATLPGIQCPGQQSNGSDITAGLLVLSLETAEFVIALDSVCSGIKKCYKTLSDAGGIALFNKDLRAYCSAIEEFLPCFENTTCACGNNKHANFEYTVNTMRVTYNSVCTVLTNGVFFKDGIRCEGDVPVNVCKLHNPISDCNVDFYQSVNQNPANINTRCLAYKDYLNCTERTACLCGLKTSAPILQALTFAHRNYDTAGCPAVSGHIEIKFGINCPVGSPNSGTAGDEILTTLGLLDNPIVISVIQQCYALEKCYNLSDTTSAKALHEKNARALCKSNSDFLHCNEQALCKCNKYTDVGYQNYLSTQKNIYLNLCGADTSLNAEFTCDACKQANPINECFLDLMASLQPDLENKKVTCPAYKRYLICAEGTACACGLRKSVSILQGLAFAHSRYNEAECKTVSGEINISFGINCPGDSISNSTDAILTTLGLMESPNVLDIIMQCPETEKCYKVADISSAKAHHEKNANAICKIHSEFIHCIEKAGCDCNKHMETNFTKNLYQLKVYLFNICPKESSVTIEYKCATVSSSLVQQYSMISLSMSIMLTLIL